MNQTPLLATLLLLLGAVATARAAPPTLLEISHAAWPAARLSNAVLVVIDAQREYAEGNLPLVNVGPATAQIARLLERARAAGTPVVHVVQVSPASRPIFAAGSHLVQEIGSVAARPGETVIAKTLPNSFAGTELESALKKVGRKDLLVVGFMTHMCVSATVRAALDHGYRCTVVAGACATRDLPDGAGGVIPAGQLQRASLAALRDRFATVVPDEDAIAP